MKGTVLADGSGTRFDVDTWALFEHLLAVDDVYEYGAVPAESHEAESVIDVARRVRIKHDGARPSSPSSQ